MNIDGQFSDGATVITISPIKETIPADDFTVNILKDRL